MRLAPAIAFVMLASAVPRGPAPALPQPPLLTGPLGEPGCPPFPNPVIKRKPAPETMAYARRLLTRADSAYAAYARVYAPATGRFMAAPGRPVAAGADTTARRVRALAAAFAAEGPPAYYAPVHAPLVAALDSLAGTVERGGASSVAERAAAAQRYRDARHRAGCRFRSAGVVVPPLRAP